jgi:predicted amidohydrolase
MPKWLWTWKANGCKWVSHKAAEYKSYIVFPIIEKRDGKLYNSAPVFGRSGELVGVYRKTHEPRVVIEEQAGDGGQRMAGL